VENDSGTEYQFVVSNPWREAIEVATVFLFQKNIQQFPILGGRLLKTAFRVIKTQSEKFPILGGRLLKRGKQIRFAKRILVSNPWREAIEENCGRAYKTGGLVSNPWREAIEV